MQRPSKFPNLEAQMIPWLTKMTRLKRTITDKSIRMKAREIADGLKIDPRQFKASSGWIDNFKRRHNIRKGVYHGIDSTSLETSSFAAPGVDQNYGVFDPTSPVNLSSSPSSLTPFPMPSNEGLGAARSSHSHSSPESKRESISTGGSSSPQHDYAYGGVEEEERGARSSVSSGRGGGQGEGRRETSQPREAFATIMNWIADQGSDFASAEEQRVLNNLSRKMQ